MIDKVCIECKKNYQTNGRELVCSALCKVHSLVEKIDSCWFIKNSSLKATVKYKNNFYVARKVIARSLDKLMYVRHCSLDKKCINPDHTIKIPEVSKKQINIFDWFKSLFKEYMYGLYK